MNKKSFGLGTLVCLMILGLKSYAQPHFRISIEEVQSFQGPALHSFACGEHQGNWIFIGGRTNGLHGFLAPLAFPNSGRNTDIIIFDPITGVQLAQPLSGLPDSIREPLMTSNMQFHQVDSTLYIVGGYGWNATQGTFITYPTLTAVDLGGLLSAIQGQTPIDGFFRQVRDSAFAICGAHLAKIDSTYHLVFGHRFDGIYDRQDTTGFHVQRYSHADRRFRIQDNGQQLIVTWLSETQDSLHFRRRDYNLVPQIFPDGSEGYTAYSGVFQKGINLPYLYPIDVMADSLEVRLNVDQQLANYHSAVVPVYDSVLNRMSTIFLGGEAMYYFDSSGTLTLDSLVPFVNTISVMERDASGNMIEYAADTVLPGLLGSNAQFLPLNGPFVDARGVIRLDHLQGRTLVGHMMGGIESPFPNISDTDPAMSWATGRLFEIYLEPISTGFEDEFHSLVPPVSLEITANPFQEHAEVIIISSNADEKRLELLDGRGSYLKTLWSSSVQGGLEIKFGSELSTGLYYLRLRSGDYMVVKRVVKLSH